MELNAEQIKKALKDLMYEAYATNGAHKPYLTMRDALALINSQEQRIKELGEENAEVKENWQKLKDSYDNNDKEWREAYADSQSKWEKAYEKLELTLEGVMHFVDKWLDGEELELDEVNRAITMRDKTLRLYEELDCMIDNLRDDINELTKENEAWQKSLITQKENADKAYYELACEVENLRAENERLKDFASSKCADCAGCTADKCDCANIEAETVRKMQERLKVHCADNRYWCELIDQIAKEMLEKT